MEWSGAEIIVKSMEREGVEIVAGIPGGSNLPLYDALSKSAIRHILARHEQGAGFIAQGMARASGRVGVCLASSGPGAANLLTAIADAKMDSVPMVAVTGQVGRAYLGTDAFQEMDVFGMTLPISKHNFLVRSAAELPGIMQSAFRIARSGRPGPVVVDVPKDVQFERAEVSDWPEAGSFEEEPEIPAEKMEELSRLLVGSERPVILAGGGFSRKGDAELLRRFAEENDIPVAMTLQGLGILPSGHPLSLGMMGMHGDVATNRLVHECDLILGLGVRFDDRATGNTHRFCPQAKVAHIDIDRAEIGKILPTDWSAIGDAADALRRLSGILRGRKRPDWSKRLSELRKKYPPASEPSGDWADPRHIIHEAARIAGNSVTVLTDVGQHQMWVAREFPFQRPGQLMTSGGLGTMGFGLPAAIGAALASSEPKLLFTGDGSILMNIQELATLAETGGNVKIILLDNGHLGLVRQQQELFYGGNIAASKFERRLDFASIARGFGIEAFDFGISENPEADFRRALEQEGPALVRIPIHETQNVLPMVPPGKANDESIF